MINREYQRSQANFFVNLLATSFMRPEYPALKAMGFSLDYWIEVEY
jgi:hypothetical protein